MEYKRISPKEAEMRLDLGESVTVVPCKMRPDSMFATTVSHVGDFRRWANNYWYYNCSKETGNSIAYYICV